MTSHRPRLLLVLRPRPDCRHPWPAIRVAIKRLLRSLRLELLDIREQPAARAAGDATPNQMESKS